MSKMIQIRNVPDDLHRELKVKAAQAAMSLSDYLLKMAEREVKTLSVDELMESVRRLGSVDLGGKTSAEIVREGREDRDAELERRNAW